MNETHGERVKAHILETGLRLWSVTPNQPVSARKIARALDMTHSAVLYHFGNSNAMQDAIAAEAVRTRNSVVVPVLIATRHPAVSGFTDAERRVYMGC